MRAPIHPLSVVVVAVGPQHHALAVCDAAALERINTVNPRTSNVMGYLPALGTKNEFFLLAERGTDVNHAAAGQRAVVGMCNYYLMWFSPKKHSPNPRPKQQQEARHAAQPEAQAQGSDAQDARKDPSRDEVHGTAPLPCAKYPSQPRRPQPGRMAQMSCAAWLSPCAER